MIAARVEQLHELATRWAEELFLARAQTAVLQTAVLWELLLQECLRKIDVNVRQPLAEHQHVLVVDVQLVRHDVSLARVVRRLLYVDNDAVVVAERLGRRRAAAGDAATSEADATHDGQLIVGGGAATGVVTRWRRATLLSC